MPSIQDVADQINAKLDSISTNTNNTVSGINQVNAHLVTLDGHVQAGFANLSQGLNALLQVQLAALSELAHHTKQNDTIICLLENSNEMLCGITRKFTHQLQLSEAMLASLKRIEGIEERAQAEAAADYDRLLEIEERMEECCPHEEPEPEPCPPACRKSDYRPVQPKTDWTPLPTPPRQPGAANRISAGR